jgi:hypothetical protein
MTRIFRSSERDRLDVAARWCSTALDDWRWSLRTPPKTDGAVAGALREYQSTGSVADATHPRGSAPDGRRGARRTCPTRSGKWLEPCARRSP